MRGEGGGEGGEGGASFVTYLWYKLPKHVQKDENRCQYAYSYPCSVE